MDERDTKRRRVGMKRKANAKVETETVGNGREVQFYFLTTFSRVLGTPFYYFNHVASQLNRGSRTSKSSGTLGNRHDVQTRSLARLWKNTTGTGPLQEN